MRRLFLSRIALMRRKGVVEGLAENVLRMLREQLLEIFGKVGVAGVGQGGLLQRR